MATATERIQQRLEPGGDPGGPAGCDREAQRCFERIQAGQRVFLFDGPVTVDGIDYWQVVADDWPGCCAPLGWVPENDSLPVLMPFAPDCPAGDAPTVAELERLGAMASIACLGSREIVVEGTILCQGGIADAPYFLGGTDWAEDPNGHGPFCAMSRPSVSPLKLWGEPVYALMTDIHQTISIPNATVYGQFDHPDSDRCLWTSGNFMPIDVSGASRDPARFACRAQFVVSHVDVGPQALIGAQRVIRGRLPAWFADDLNTPSFWRQESHLQ